MSGESGDKGVTKSDSDAAKAVRFLAIKAALFMALPLAIALIVAYLTLK